MLSTTSNTVHFLCLNRLLFNNHFPKSISTYTAINMALYHDPTETNLWHYNERIMKEAVIGLLVLKTKHACISHTRTSSAYWKKMNKNNARGLNTISSALWYRPIADIRHYRKLLMFFILKIWIGCTWSKRSSTNLHDNNAKYLNMQIPLQIS